ncbi:MAG: alpha/beta hydrolase [Bifidobacteriaceae bacterium]|jgi:acetyl esterase|nr:alpha/beta hydrolase [Bifidobacteriaceae bacterium]
MSIDPLITRIRAQVKSPAGGRPGPAEWRAEALRVDNLLADLAYAEAPDCQTEDVTIAVDGHPPVHLRLYRPLPARPARGGGRDRTAATAGPDGIGAGVGRGPDGIGGGVVRGPAGDRADVPGGIGAGLVREPAGDRADVPDGEPAPGAYVGFFGGAFRQGGLDFPSVDRAWRSRAVRAGIVVVGVDYALAPEHPYPAAVEQGYAAVAWVAEHAAELGVDPARLAVGGMSSGGNLAAAAALMARDRGGPALALQLLEVPALDLTGRHLRLSAGRGQGVPPILVKLGLRSVAKTYLGAGGAARAREPYASPLLAPDLAGAPPALILVAEHDLLRGDGEAYAARLRRAGVDATALVYLGHTHESAAFTKVLASARHWQGTVEAALARTPAAAPPRPAASTFIGLNPPHSSA